MLEVVRDEAAQDEVDGRSLLDEIAREGARRMLVAALETATNIARLTNEWETEYRAFQKRSLADRDYVYVRVDGAQREGKVNRTKTKAA